MTMGCERHLGSPLRVTYDDDAATILGEECVECEIARLKMERAEALAERDSALRERDAMAGPSGAHASTLEMAAVALAKERDAARQERDLARVEWEILKHTIANLEDELARVCQAYEDERAKREATEKAGEEIRRRNEVLLEQNKQLKAFQEAILNTKPSSTNP